MWRGHAAVRGGQHLAQVVHNHQILPKDVEQRERDAHLHLPGPLHRGRTSRLELDFCHLHRVSVSGVQSSGFVSQRPSALMFATRPTRNTDCLQFLSLQA